MKKIYLLLFLWPIATGLKAQTAVDSIFLLPDTVKGFSLENLYTSMLAAHPIVKQAKLLNESARQEIRMARGAFDPKLQAQFDIKEFEQKEYYNKFSTYLTIPTWFPVDPKIGFEKNTGTYLNPETQVGGYNTNNQLATGISIPLGRGLFTDDRRTAIRQANNFTKLMEAEQIKLVNKILLDAAKDYWQWYYAYYNYRLLNRNTTIAKEIFRRTHLNASQGEASAMDTVQASIILQQRLVERQEAWLDFLNMSLQISNYLWDQDGNPIQVSFMVAPVLTKQDNQILSEQTVAELIAQAKQNHPELMKLRVKLSQLEIDQKLNKEYLKPKLDLSYYWINQPITAQGELQPFKWVNDYKFGLDFSMPILIRKERGKLAQTKIKINSTQLELQQLERETINQINVVYNQLINTGKVLGQQNRMVLNYEKLLKAELLNWTHGESDLFKISLQQEKMVQSQSKLLKLKAEYEKLKATLYWTAGVRNLTFTE